MADKLGELLGKTFKQGDSLSSIEQTDVLGKIEAAIREGKMGREEVEKVLKTIRFLGAISPELADNLGAELLKIADQAQPVNEPIQPAGVQGKQILFWLLLIGMAALVWYLVSTSR